MIPEKLASKNSSKASESREKRGKVHVKKSRHNGFLQVGRSRRNLSRGSWVNLISSKNGHFEDGTGVENNQW